MNEYKCDVCKDTGIMKYYEIDGMTIYRWQKPLTKPCTYCNAYSMLNGGLPVGKIWCIIGKSGSGKSIFQG